MTEHSEHPCKCPAHSGIKIDIDNLKKSRNEDNLILKNYFDNKIESLDKATEKAEKAAEKRFESVNEFREQLRDQQNTFVRKNEVDIRFDAMEKKIDGALSQLQLTKGRDSGLSISGGIIIIVISIIISITSLIITLLK